MASCMMGALCIGGYLGVSYMVWFVVSRLSHYVNPLAAQYARIVAFREQHQQATMGMVFGVIILMAILAYPSIIVEGMAVVIYGAAAGLLVLTGVIGVTLALGSVGVAQNSAKRSRYRRRRAHHARRSQGKSKRKPKYKRKNEWL